MASDSGSQLRIEGSVAAGFEPVRALFERNMRVLAEENAQLCVYHRGQQVVDLWASASGDNGFAADSLVNIFSSGKSLESIALAWLVSKGLLDYDARITDYWPAFGASGKENLTVADLMRHEAGLANFTVSIDPQDLLADNIKRNAVGGIIEQQPSRFGPDGKKREYHAISRGWVVNEIFRRVDPAGRTVGEFLHQEVRGGLGAETVCGVSEPELKRIWPVKMLGLGFQLWQSLIPKFMGRKVVHNVFQLLGRFLRIIPSIRKGTARGAPPAFTGMTSVRMFNDPAVAMGETPSANTHANARGLARVAAMMSAKGQFGEQPFMSEQAWSALHANATESAMGGLIPTRFTQGGVNRFDPCGPGTGRMEKDFTIGREGFYGWMGFGGSILQWHPEQDIGFGFVPTAMHYLDLFNERGKVYQAEVLNCVAQLDQAKPGA